MSSGAPKFAQVRQMRKEHEEILKEFCSCDKCGTYFDTRNLLEVHNKKEHNL